MVRFLFALCLLGKFLFIGSTAYGQTTDTAQRAVEANTDASRYEVGEELIFTLVVDKYILGDYFVLVTEDGFAIDFESLIEVLDFPIEYKTNATYEGWFISPDNTFVIDFNDVNENGIRAEISGDVSRIPSSKALNIGNINYLSVSAIEQLFPLRFDFDNSSLTATLIPLEKLPLQNKLARERSKVSETRGASKAEFPQLSRDYELLSAQSLDVQVNANYVDDTGVFSDGYSVIGGREVAYLNSRFFISGNSDDLLQSARLTLSRNYSDGFVADILNVKRIEVGDVNPVQIGNQSFRGDTLGLVFTNDAGQRELNDQRSITISGEVQVGWDVELYRNDLLIDRKFDVVDGRYDFEDVELYLGDNLFRVVLYGPQGQEITREIDRYVDASTQGVEGLLYRSSLTKLDSALFNTRSAKIFENDVFDWSTQISKGITQSTGLSLGWRLQSSNEGVNEIVAGINTAITDRVRLNVEYAKDSEDSQRINATLRTRIGQQDINFNATSLNENDKKSNSYSVSNRGALGISDSLRVNYLNEIAYVDSGISEQYRALNDIAIPIPYGVLNHSIEYLRRQITLPGDNLPDRIQEEILGSLNVRSRLLGVTARAGVNYRYQDEFDIDSYVMDFAWQPREYIRTRLNLSYSPKVKDLFTRFDIGYENDLFNLSANISHSDINGVRVGVSTRVSLGGEPFTEDVFYTRRSLNNSGTLVVRVFEDLNANAIYDEGERVVEGVEVRSLQSLARARTDVDGLALLQGLSATKVTDIVIDADTIDEPFLMPIIEGVSILPRQNFIDSIDYPLIYLSELEGQFEFKGENATSTKFPNILLELKSDRGQVIASANTEFDGYFYIADIPPGNYKLHVSAKDLDRNGYRELRPISVRFTGVSEFISLDPIELTSIKAFNGYTVQIASLDNLSMLKSLYESMLVRNIGGIRQLPSFYTSGDNKYHLNVGFYSQQSQADLLCISLKGQNLPCNVLPHTQRENGSLVR